MKDRADHEREHFFGAAKVVAGMTMLSRVLGLVRDVAIVSLGANRATDSFWTAFRVPNVFRRLFGEGALTAAFVPIFTETAETRGWDHARGVLANCLGLLAIVLAVVVVVIELALACVLIFAPGGSDRVLLVQLTMLVLPFMFTICLLALGAAALNCRGHFAYPAFAPIILNIFLIAAAVVVHLFMKDGQWRGLFVLAGSVVAAGVAQLVGVFWLLGRSHMTARPRIRPVAAEVKRIAALSLPMMIPLGLTQICSLFESFYAWFMTATEANPTFTVFGVTIAKPLTAGVVTCLYAAERLYNFPLGILAISLATAVFPLMSRYAARGDMAGLRGATNRALRLSLFLGIPSGAALMLLAGPATVLIYRHGGFNSADAARAAMILRMYCLGMWAYFCRHILLRAFFAQKDVRTVLRISCVLAAGDVLLVAGLVFTPLRGAGIGLATAGTASVNALVLIWLLHRRWGKLGLRRIIASLGRTALAATVMSLAIAGVAVLLAGRSADWSAGLAAGLTKGWFAGLTAGLAAGLTGGSQATAALVIAVAVPVGIGAFGLSAAVMRSSELGELWGAIRHRSTGGPDGPDGAEQAGGVEQPSGAEPPGGPGRAEQPGDAGRDRPV